MNRARNRDPARLANGFETRGDIDAVAKNIAAIDDDVADIDADPQCQSGLRSRTRLEVEHVALDRGRAAHGIDDACEFGEQAVSRRLDDAAAASRHQRIEDL